METDCAGHTQRDTATDNPANQAADSHPEINNPSQMIMPTERLLLMCPEINTVGIRNAEKLCPIRGRFPC
jgi:hypothetical protein